MAKIAFILAGEASGDKLAGPLMAAADKALGPFDWFGIGGNDMLARGLSSIGDMQQLSIIGLSASLRGLPALSKLADRLIDEILTRQPAYIFTVDTKGFSVRFAKRLRKRLKGGSYQPCLVHMVAPTLWAWGAWRAKKFAWQFDVILCLFPIEPAYFKGLNTKAFFCGHPEAQSGYRQLPATKDWHVLLLPGSRKSEIRHLLPVMLESCRQLKQHYRQIKFSLPLSGHLHDDANQIIHQHGFEGEIVPADVLPKTLFKTAHFVQAGSGTVTLEVALAGISGVVIYHLSLINRLFVKLFYKQHTPVLPDILLGTENYPFLLTPELNADILTQKTIEGLSIVHEKAQEMKQASRLLQQTLDPDNQGFQPRLEKILSSLGS